MEALELRQSSRWEPRWEIWRPILATLLLAVPCFALQGTTDPSEAALELGREALEKGELGAANRHFRVALEHSPGSTEILAHLLATCAADEDARTLWAHEWYAAAADENGKAQPDTKLRSELPDDPFLAKIASARAAAVRELVSFSAARQKKGRKEPGELLVARWARRLALELAREARALEAGPARGLSPELELPSGFHREVIDALKPVLANALAKGRTDVSVRAARLLRGLAVQASFKDLKGPRPTGMDKIRELAEKGLERARAQVADRVGEPWTLDELEWLTQEEGEAFTRQHAGFGLPGVSVSPQSRYRIETDCGFETLLGVTRTVEDHHERLASWYGQDPFADRQGIVRIVPEAHGLESEGAPFWWAGGFQGGDVTTLRFSIGTIEGLGRGLTHELTHRFDGALYPGQPAWLSEGKAVWTGAAYGHSTDEAFLPTHASFGTIESAFIKGYGGVKKLEELVTGELEDYRDNYVAGYALYVYLATWEHDGRVLYADRLQAFMENALEGAKKPKRFFSEHFADGDDGRPEDFDAFAAAFGEFLAGFFWKNLAPWTLRYTRESGAQGGEPLVFDEPTWVWSRVRAEPTFGQDHARAAGDLLFELGKYREAVHAYVWALAADGRSPASEERLSRALGELRKNNARWVVQHGLEFPTGSATSPAPFLGSLSKTRALRTTTFDAAQVEETPVAAAALAADHDRLAAWLGTARLSTRSDVRELGNHPFDRSGRPAGLGGWVEDELTNYEERRVPDLWYETENGDLFVGRKQPRRGTGRMDRNAHQNQAFARTSEWLLPGTYRLKARVQFTTSYVAGAVVLGYERRDRNLRLSFNAGDFMYAIGENEDMPEFESMHWNLSGLRARDGALTGSTCGGTFDFSRPSLTFDLELLVDGSSVHVFINGARQGIYHTVDGAPIEGYVGFATRQGAIRVQHPRVERFERSRLAGLSLPAPTGLDLDRAGDASFDDLANLPVRGIARSTNGTLLLWIPVPELDSDEPFDPEEIVRDATRSATRLVTLIERIGASQPLVLAVPDRLEEARVAALASELGSRVEVRAHAYTGATVPSLGTSADRGRRWIFFVDSAGVARVVRRFFGQESGFDGDLLRWVSAFRDHGRPPRNLPEVVREPASPKKTRTARALYGLCIEIAN